MSRFLRMHGPTVFVALSFAAASTSTLGIGTDICLVPQRDPIVTAKAVATRDVLSNGGVLFGVGAGWVPEEMANHGVRPDERWAVMNERVEAMCRIWAQDQVEFHGRHIEFGPIESWPKPLQRPRPPDPRRRRGSWGAAASNRRTATSGCPTAAPPSTRSPSATTNGRSSQLWPDAEPIPITVYVPPPTTERLEQLAAIGVHRVLLKAGVADASGWDRFLDDSYALVGD